MVKVVPSQSPSFEGLSDLSGLSSAGLNNILMSHLRDLNSKKFTSKDKAKKRIDVFSVSQSSYDCYRKVYFEMVEPRQADNSVLGTFAIGDLIDNICKEAFKKVGGVADVGCGKSCAGGKIRIQGTDDIEFGGKIIEVKSVSPFAWKYYVGGKDKDGKVIVGAPKIQHVRQLNSYMGLRGISEGILLYVNKDSFFVKDFSVSYDPQLMIQTVGRCLIVKKYIDKGEPPQKVKCDECNYCNYTDLCKKY